MLYEYLLISVAVASGYWGVYFTRRRPHGSATFGLMQLAAAALAGLGLLGRYREGPDVLALAGAIGLGAGACLLVLGPLARAAARWVAAPPLERLGLASRLLAIADVLAPGSGVAEDRAVLAAMREIRDGEVGPTIAALEAAKREAPVAGDDRRAPGEAVQVDDVRRAIDERIVLLYVAAFRWADAIAHAEAELLVGPLPAPLPTSAPVWVELIGAYARTGDLARAAAMLATLEDACADRTDTAAWQHRGRLLLLALAGRVPAVDALLAPRQAAHMSRAAREFWRAVAHDHAGDRATALAGYTRARRGARGRARAQLDAAVARLAENPPPDAPLAPEVAAVIARIEAAPLPAVVARPRRRRRWATPVLVGSLLAVAATVTLALGSTGDLGVLVRAGAMVRGVVDGGEWWRLVTCVFLHVGTVHLVVNAVGLYFLGRVVDELFGGARTIAIFAVAGLAGSLASYAASPAGMSAGASGAVFGLLGALFIELTWHRALYRAAWKRGMWGGIVFVTLAQLGVGFLYPVIDQWAHGAGLLGGVLAGAALSPNARWARPGLLVARVAAIAFAALVAVSGALVVRTSIADSLARVPAERRAIGAVAITAPRTWFDATGLASPDGLVLASAHRIVDAPHNRDLETWTRHAIDSAQRRELSPVTVAPTSLVALPDGWRGHELVAGYEDAMGTRQHHRVIVCGRVVDGSVIVLVIYAPASVVAAAPGFFRALIASAGPA